ncbi:MAG: hypothetical protein ACLGPL_11350 [Acidobacteriota bacterium]
MDQCPVCNRELTRFWENTGRGWFSGLYNCPEHGRIKASGGYDGKEKTIYCWYPSCSLHGADHVIRINETRFGCTIPECNRFFEVRNGRIIPTRKFSRAEMVRALISHSLMPQMAGA